MTSKKGTIILEASALDIGYFSKKNTNTVASNLHFRFQEGTLISLVGPNGIGKSTLLRTLTAMQASLKGEVKIKGRLIDSYHPLELAGLLSVVLTETPSSKNLSVLEFVSLGRQPHTNWLGQLTPNDKDRVEQALAYTDTATLSQRKCFELSDGQMQRVAIARALAQDTPLIILDEPTTHLDLYHRAYVLKLLKKLSKEANKTILYSTHEIDLAIQLSDQMMVMEPGTVQIDTPKELIEKGAFNSLFPEDTIIFDKNTGRFTIR